MPHAFFADPIFQIIFQFFLCYDFLELRLDNWTTILKNTIIFSFCVFVDILLDSLPQTSLFQ